MGLSHSPRIVTDGLVFCVDAGDKMSYPGAGTTWTDLSKNRNNGTLVNGPTFDSANGGSIVFDGTNDYVDLGSPSDLATGSSNFSWNVWVKTPSSFSGYKMILSTDLYYCYLSLYNNQFTFDTNSNSTHRYGTLSANTWYNTTVVRNSNVDYFYINSIFIDSESDSTSVSGTFNIGRWNYNDTLYYNSNISTIQIYNRALSAAEILQNYLSTKERLA